MGPSATRPMNSRAPNTWAGVDQPGTRPWTSTSVSHVSRSALVSGRLAERAYRVDRKRLANVRRDALRLSACAVQGLDVLNELRPGHASRIAVHQPFDI